MGTHTQSQGDPRVETMMLRSNKDAAIDFMHLVSTGHVKQAFSQYVDNTFRHHDPFFEAGALALMNAMDDNARQHPAKQFTAHHVIAEGSLVAIHGHVRHEPGDIGFALAHVFRFRDGKIVEMWELGQAIPSSSPNVDGMF